jgi:hypothetical protein
MCEKTISKHKSELKNLRLGFVIKPKGTLPVSPLDITQEEWIENCERIFGGDPNNG